MMRSSSSKSALLQEELCGLAKEARWLDALEKLESYDDIASLDATLVSEIREFGGEFRRAQRECADASIEWEEGHSYLGTETKFRYDDGGVLWLSTEGSMEEVSAYHAVSVIREVALFGEWVPMIRWGNVVEALYFLRRRSQGRPREGLRTPVRGVRRLEERRLPILRGLESRGRRDLLRPGTTAKNLGPRIRPHVRQGAPRAHRVPIADVAAMQDRRRRRLEDTPAALSPGLPHEAPRRRLPAPLEAPGALPRQPPRVAPSPKN